MAASGRKTGPDTRGEILAQARALFARRGFEAVSMRDIAEAVGIRPSSIYNHFQGKHALLDDLMTRHMERVLRKMEAALAAPTDPTDRLNAFARYHLLIHLDYPDDVFLAYYEMRSLEPEARARIVALRDAYEGHLRTILTVGRDAGTFSLGDPAVLARGILSMLTGVTVWYREGGPLPRDAVVETYIRAVMQSVGLHAAAPTAV